jgi:prophage antirepressor-like protein
MSTLIDLYNGLIKYNDNDIVIVIDNMNLIWFYGRQIAKILGYKRTQEIISRLDPSNKKPYGDLKYYSQYKYNVQDHAIFINESALYELTFKSRMPEAVRFKKWITSEVIPTLRKTGKYEIESKYVKKLEDTNEELKKYKKRVKVLENNQKKSRYPDGGYIYVLKAPGSNETNYKIGKTKNLNKRLNTYNTTLPDNVVVIYKKKVNSPTAVELVLRGLLNEYIYRNNKEYYKVGLKHIKKLIDYCDDLVNHKIKIKRATIDSDDPDDDQIIFNILAVENDNNIQIGGNSDSDLALYIDNKNKYIAIKLILFTL